MLKTKRKETSFFQNIKNFFSNTFNIRGSKKKYQDELNLTFSEIVTAKGYPFEEHQVVTEDGYILTIFRIPGGKGEKDYLNKQKQAVFLQHGLLDSSDCWVSNHENNCIAYIFANKGFDVWLGNVRGNKYSRNHQTINPDDELFWDYSFHEMGLLDLPACFNYILGINKATNKIIYLGHSQGGCMIFAALSQKIEYFKTVLLAVIGLGPASQLNHIDSDLLRFIDKYFVYEFLKENKIFEVLPFKKNLAKLNGEILKVYPLISFAFMEYLSDSETYVNCPERLIVFLNRYPSGTSLKSLQHFRNIIKTKRFTFYDYEDKEKNIEKYNSETPPIYDLSNIKDIPIIICAGQNDRMTSVGDIRWLKDQVKDTLYNYYEYKYMGHASFVLSNDMIWFNDVLRDIYKIMDKNK